MAMNQNLFAIGDLYLNKGNCFIFQRPNSSEGGLNVCKTGTQADHTGESLTFNIPRTTQQQ